MAQSALESARGKLVSRLILGWRRGGSASRPTYRGGAKSTRPRGVISQHCWTVVGGDGERGPTQNPCSQPRPPNTAGKKTSSSPWRIHRRAFGEDVPVKKFLKPGVAPRKMRVGQTVMQPDAVLRCLTAHCMYCCPTHSYQIRSTRCRPPCCQRAATRARRTQGPPWSPTCNVRLARPAHRP